MSSIAGAMLTVAPFTSDYHCSSYFFLALVPRGRSQGPPDNTVSAAGPETRSAALLLVALPAPSSLGQVGPARRHADSGRANNGSGLVKAARSARLRSKAWGALV